VRTEEAAKLTKEIGDLKQQIERLENMIASFKK
jgi:hypothetical protein